MKNCEEITMDIEKGHMDGLSTKERLAVKMHIMLCKPCRQYSKDSTLIDSMLKRKYKHPVEYQFSLEEKESLKSKLNA